MSPTDNAERQRAFRARRLMLGQTEVRGIYLQPELHAELKAYAKKLAKLFSANASAQRATDEQS